MPPEDGYGFDPGTLGSVSSNLNDAASSLSEAIGGMPPVDAGRTSGQAGETMLTLQQSGVGIVGVFTGMAGNIDAADGSYAKVENKVTEHYDGMAQWEKDYPRKDPHAPHTGPLMDAPDAVDNLQYDQPWEKR